MRDHGFEAKMAAKSSLSHCVAFDPISVILD
jgi:hypothetical protein